MLKPKDTLAMSGAMNLSRSTEDLKTIPLNKPTGKVIWDEKVLSITQTNTARRYLQIPLPLPEFFPIGQWNRFK